jgi:hypothetical protein
MIKNISGGGKYLSVSGGAGSTYVNNYSGAQGVGNMRYNTSTQNIEVYDGANWVQMQSGYATISMTPEAESLLDWARQKRQEEMELESLARDNPAVKDLLNQRNDIDSKISMVTTLIKNHQSDGQNV